MMIEEKYYKKKQVRLIYIVSIFRPFLFLHAFLVRIFISLYPLYILGYGPEPP